MRCASLLLHMEKVIRAAMAVVVVALLAAAGGGEAAVYEVGDSVGWTIMNSPNYTAWASSKTFHVGDTVVFVYNNQFHNALEVSESDYMSCSAASPIANYTTGNDSVVLNRSGHFYFLCGFPGHCLAGQKVDISVSAAASSAAPSKTPSAAPSPSQGNGAAAAGAGVVPKALAFAAAVVSFAAVRGGGFLMN